MIGWKDTAFGVVGASLATGSGPSSTGNLGSRPTDCGGPVNVPEEGVSWREILWLCLTFHDCLPRTSLAVSESLSLSLTHTLTLSLTVSLTQPSSRSLLG